MAATNHLRAWRTGVETGEQPTGVRLRGRLVSWKTLATTTTDDARFLRVSIEFCFGFACGVQFTRLWLRRLRGPRLVEVNTLSRHRMQLCRAHAAHTRAHTCTHTHTHARTHTFTPLLLSSCYLLRALSAHFKQLWSCSRTSFEAVIVPCFLFNLQIMLC